MFPKVKTGRKIIIGAVIGVIVFGCLLSFWSKPPLNRSSTAEYKRSAKKINPKIAQERASTLGSTSNVDHILKRLEFGNFAFNAPKTMNLQDTAVIQVLLGLEKSIDELKQMIAPEGEKEGASIQVSDRMEARLSGPKLAINAITPEIQAVSRNHITAWKREVKPSSTGHLYLHLTLSAFLNLDGESTPRAFQTFDKVIDVEVTWSQQARSFFEENWQWLWPAILAPIAGWLWKRKKTPKRIAHFRKKKRSVEPEKTSPELRRMGNLPGDES